MNIHRNRVWVMVVVGVVAMGLLWPVTRVFAAEGDSGVVMVKAKAKPASKWKEYSTRTLAGVSGFTPGEKKIELDKYGGRADRAEKATGFFYAKEFNGRWWLIDPLGHPFIHVAVASISPARTPTAAPAYQALFGDSKTWGEKTAQLLHDNGFNGAGAWTAAEPLRASSKPVAYTLIWNFVSGFAKSKKLTHVTPGHTGFYNDCMPVLHPEFPAWCDQVAGALAATKDDPYLLGHFSDNELPMPRLEKFLALEADHPEMGSSRRAAEQWLAARKGKAAVSAKDITDKDRDEFAGYVWGKYFEITTAAIRKHDPNHLCLGSRFHSIEKKSPASFAAAGKHLDVVSVNLYGQWTPDREMLSNWATKWSGKPFLITEWYTKGEDSGMKNSTGAGWIVPTQKDRGRFYQNFTLALMETKGCVGWHWFKYQDNDPAALNAEPSNQDSNKGIVNIKYEPYAPLLEAMKQLNREVYPLIDHFDKNRQ